MSNKRLKWNTLWVFVILVFCVAGLFGQDQAKRIQVDEFGKSSCEELLARADSLGIQLQSHPGYAAQVVISGNGESSRKADAWAKLIHRSLIGRSLDEFRPVRIIRNRAKNEIGGEIWLIPLGTENTESLGEAYLTIPYSPTKPVLFGSDTGDPCNENIPNGFARMMKSDPNLKGRVVVYNVPNRSRKRDVKEWREYLTHELKIPLNRITLFYAKGPKDVFAEFWLIPRRKR